MTHPTVAVAATGRPKFEGRFWALIIMEMFERLSFYTLRVMAPIYIMQADDPGGLRLTPRDKGTIYLWWAIFQSGLPIVTGGIADRYGYKRVLTFAFTMMSTGYVMVALLRDLTWLPAVVDANGVVLVTAAARSNFWTVFASIMVLATGTAFFKPSLQGSLAHSLTRENSSVGWGIFYWIVNIGAFVGHYLPALFLADAHTPAAWRNLFLCAAAFAMVNFLILPFVRDVPSGAPKDETIGRVLIRTITNILEPRLIAWLLIMSGFWMMMYQLWDTQPNFIADWIDSRPLARCLEWLPPGVFRRLTEQTPRGMMVPQNVLLSLNSCFIILGVLGMAWLTRRMRTLTTMFGGMLMATTGMLVAGWTMSPWMLVLGILFFSLGEMTTGPKKSEYLGLIAPPGKKGLYLGYVNIPVGIGQGVGNWIAGIVYASHGEKAILALRYLAEKTPLGQRQAWDGRMASLEATLGISRSNAMTRLQEVTGLDAPEATRLLWDTYSPQYHVWLPFAAIGVVSAVALAIFGQMAKRWKDMNA